MSKIKINPKQLAGAVTPPSSKSMTHRLIICAALAQGSSTIQNVDVSQDVLATLNCIEMMGAEWVRVDARTIQVIGIGGLTALGAECAARQRDQGADLARHDGGVAEARPLSPELRAG
ncbi:MAG: hypothetical protein VB071_00490, partial [Lawsonibacter sp.]|nr:hypothetical protein [Lawsonibacter sp.]